MNTQLKTLLAGISLALLTPTAAVADDAHHKPANAVAIAGDDMTDAEVRKVNTDGGKVKIRAINDAENFTVTALQLAP